MRLPRALAFLVALSAGATACSTILGLGDFKNAEQDASVGSGGSAGTAGSEATGGASGNAGTGGSAGTAGTAGAAGGDSGPTTVKCQNVGATVDLDDPDAGAVTIGDHGLWLAEDPSQDRVFVVIATSAGMLVRAVAYSNALTLGNPTLVSTVTTDPGGVAVGNNTLDVYTDDLQKVEFSVGGGSAADLTLLPTTPVASCPANTDEAPNQARYGFDSNQQLHWAATCSGTSTTELVVDGTTWLQTGSPSDKDLEVQDYAYLGATQDGGTGQGMVVLGDHHQFLDVNNGGEKSFNIAQDDGGTSQSGATAIWKPSSGHFGLAGTEIHIANGLQASADFYTGVMAVTDVGELVTAPKSVLNDVVFVSSLSKGPGPTTLAEDPHSLWWAGTNTPSTSVLMLRLNPMNGALQSPVRDVVDAPDGGATLIDAAAAPFINSFGSTGLVVWVDSDSNVYGQLVVCTS
jgi:hypothetical protein